MNESQLKPTGAASRLAIIRINASALAEQSPAEEVRKIAGGVAKMCDKLAELLPDGDRREIANLGISIGKVATFLDLHGEVD